MLDLDIAQDQKIPKYYRYEEYNITESVYGMFCSLSVEKSRLHIKYTCTFPFYDSVNCTVRHQYQYFCNLVVQIK